MQRFLIMINVTILFLISLLMILMITLQFSEKLRRSIMMMTAHWTGCEMIKTGPLVLAEPEEQSNENIITAQRTTSLNKICILLINSE